MELQRDMSLAASAERLRRRNLGIRHGFSIGAGTGGDTAFLHRTLCPESKLLLIEAQGLHSEALDEVVGGNANLTYEICAAAEQDGTASFLASAPTGGAVVTGSAGTVTIPARSIDSLSAERNWDGPFLLKFDTHGVELDILAGATETLQRTALVMMETYNFRLNFVGGKNLLFYEMCQWMEAHGMRCVDMCEPLFRPNDLALWQMQLFFVRTDHKVFASNGYQAAL